SGVAQAQHIGPRPASTTVATSNADPRSARQQSSVDQRPAVVSRGAAARTAERSRMLTWGDVGKFVLAFFLPPLGVLTETERLNKTFWINVLLTLLAWLLSQAAHQPMGTASVMLRALVCMLLMLCSLASSTPSTSSSSTERAYTRLDCHIPQASPDHTG
ncbi:hypothetical protein QJQ45_015604, partial [Haematococcus lacustris]